MSRNAMKPSLGLRQAQQLALTPQLQQSIRLLQMSTAELEQEIEQDASSLSRTLDDAQEIEQDGTGYRAGTREVEGAHRAG